MAYHQTLRWVLTDSEAARLGFDSDDLTRQWTRSQPWFVSWWATLPAQRLTGRCA